MNPQERNLQENTDVNNGCFTLILSLVGLEQVMRVGTKITDQETGESKFFPVSINSGIVETVCYRIGHMVIGEDQSKVIIRRKRSNRKK